MDFIAHAAKAHNIPIEELERECLDYLRTGSERGFQFLRLVLDYAMDLQRGGLPGVEVRVVRAGSPDHLPALEVLARDFSEIQEDDQTIATWAQGYVTGHAWRISRDVELAIAAAEERAPDNPKGVAILEVGSAPYLFTAYMQRQGYNIRGLDLDPGRQPNLIEAEGLTVIPHDLESDDPGTDLIGAYELIVLNEVFEHLRFNPLATLRKLHRWLKPEGKLILSTPNAQSLEGFRKYISPGVMFGLSAVPFFEYSKLEIIGHMGHVREYTAPEVMHTLAKLGFVPERLTYRFSPDLLAKMVIPFAHARWGSDFIVTCRKDEPENNPQNIEEAADDPD